MAVINVIGLGPAGPDLVTSNALALIDSELPLWLRTAKHPAASIAGRAQTFDEVYERASNIDSVYEEIVARLLREARDRGDLVYAVPGSPLVAESTVALLTKAVDESGDVEVVVHPAMSFLDLSWARLNVDPFAGGARLVDGHRFALDAAGERGPLLVAQCDSQWVLSDVKLAFEDVTPERVTVLQRLGLPDESVFTVDWHDLDREVQADHLTSLWIQSFEAPVARELVHLNSVATRLRKDCPWDQEQTHSSLARHLIEEAYELTEAIDEYTSAEAAEDDESLAAAETALIEELGDVLFQVLAHTAIAEEEGRFNLADVADTIATKLITRHPHVYGDVVAETSADVKASWEVNKKAEKNRESLMDGMPRHLPSLMYATKVIKRARGAGVQFDDEDLATQGVGGALMLLVEEARRRDIEPEEALRKSADEFRDRFRRAERIAAADGIDLATAGATAAGDYWQRAGREQ